MSFSNSVMVTMMMMMYPKGRKLKSGEERDNERHTERQVDRMETFSDVAKNNNSLCDGKEMLDGSPLSSAVVIVLRGPNW